MLKPRAAIPSALEAYSLNFTVVPHGIWVI